MGRAHAGVNAGVLKYLAKQGCKGVDINKNVINPASLKAGTLF
jgi:hypothetical protein